MWFYIFPHNGKLPIRFFLYHSYTCVWYLFYCIYNEDTFWLVKRRNAYQQLEQSVEHLKIRATHLQYMYCTQNSCNWMCIGNTGPCHVLYARLNRTMKISESNNWKDTGRRTIIESPPIENAYPNLMPAPFQQTIQKYETFCDSVECKTLLFLYYVLFFDSTYIYFFRLTFSFIVHRLCVQCMEHGTAHQT